MKRKPQQLAMYIVLIAAAALFASPLLMMALSSLKSIAELKSNPYSILPGRLVWKNYPDAVSSMPYLRFLNNSLILCIGSVVGTVSSCSIVAYGFSRVRWPGRDLVFGIVIATMLLPWHVTMIPRFLLIREIGLYNSLGALILPTFLGEALYIFLLRQFFLTIPEELSEAARMDGLGDWGIFWKIVLPLSVPALATVALFQFIHSWNDFNGPLLYLSDVDNLPLAYGLERFISSYSDQTHLLLAAAVLFTLPILILFLLAQRTFLRGIVTTGIKG